MNKRELIMRFDLGVNMKHDVYSMEEFIENIKNGNIEVYRVDITTKVEDQTLQEKLDITDDFRNFIKKA